MSEGWKPHPLGLGYAKCLPDVRWSQDEFVERMGDALVGLVPLRFTELHGAGQAVWQSLAQGAVRTITEKGDVFQFRKNQRNWKPSEVLSALVTAYAVLALNTPDTGVTFFAFHACYWEHPGCPMWQDG